MFAGNTVLSSLDRLSVKSVLTGKTGTICGLIASILFIVLCFIIFIGPIIFYFQGDFVQSSFKVMKAEGLKLYSGCDFKLALSFHKKSTGEVADHSQIPNFVKTITFYVSPYKSQFSGPVEKCNEQYFSEMKEKPQTFGENDCFIVPNKLGYFSEIAKGYRSVFGFKFTPQCISPFLCTALETMNELTASEMVQFFKNHYYVMYFTSQVINQRGEVSKQFYKVFSTEYDGHETVLPKIFLNLETEKVFMDSSIMPWFNNDTMLNSVWYGNKEAIIFSEDMVESYGSSAYLTTVSYETMKFREYRKLDWLLGMLGGGLFLLYLIFWVVFNYISTTKQKIQACQSLILVHDGSYKTDDLRKPTIGWQYYLLSWLPFSDNFSCLRTEHKALRESQKMLDVVDLIKKQKVTMRNLKKNGHFHDFKQRRLEMNQKYNENQINVIIPNEEQQKFELQNKTISSIRSQVTMPVINQSNVGMLAICSNEESQRIIDAQNENKFSKFEVNKFNEREGNCQKVQRGLAEFIRFFDVFGSKPILNGNPNNYSLCGCLFSLLILILAILTFALTLHNMGITRTYMDKIYKSPNQLFLNLTTNGNYHMVFCLNRLAFDNNLIVGQNRIVDIKYFQYERTGKKQSYEYFTPIWMKNETTQYFNSVDAEDYGITNFTLCLRPQHGINFLMYGSEETKDEGYFGVTMKPYCSGLPSDCLSQQNVTNSKFLDFLNTYAIWTIIPENKYYPDKGKIIANPLIKNLNRVMRDEITSYTQSIKQTIYMSTIELIDDTSSWIVGETPEPKVKTLANQMINLLTTAQTVPNDNLEYQLKVKANGSVERIILTNYKVDFLLSTIGGCFIFYYLIFGCFGKLYNHYLLKSKLASALYDEDDSGQSIFHSLCKILRIPCCRDRVISKIEKDLDCLSLVQNVTNCYYLSTNSFQSMEKKNLSLIYLKERIKEDEKIIIVKNQQQRLPEILEVDDQDFFEDWEAERTKQNRKLVGKSGIANINEDVMSDSMKIMEKSLIEFENEKQIEQEEDEEYTPNRRRYKIQSICNELDFFKNQQQLTLDGKRSVQSVCGGICCLICLVLMILVTQHFLSVYFSDSRSISTQKIVDQINPENTKIELEVGKNFKLMLSFFNVRSYQMADVRSLASNVGISVVKYNINRDKSNHEVTVKQEYIDLEPCSQSYLDGFVGEYIDKHYFTNITNGYCVPDGTKLTLMGTTDQPIKEYFKLSIYNKDGGASLVNTKQLLLKYLPRYHISQPTEDYRTDSQIKYSMYTLIESNFLQTGYSRKFNTTIQKAFIKYDTAVNPANEHPSFQSYKIDTHNFNELQIPLTQSNARFCDLEFTAETFYIENTVKKMKVNELFGVIGGCIVFMFFGLGCCARSFNSYRMRYLVGSKLYTIMGKKKTLQAKKRAWKSKKQSDNEETKNFSEWKLLQAWMLSHLAMLQQNYNSSSVLRLVSLLQMRASKDMNLYEFYKNHYACESSIKGLNLTPENTPNLCRTYAKQLVSTLNEQSPQIKSEDLDPELRAAAKVNQLSDWQIEVVQIARSKSINISEVFDEKWLDRHWGIDRSHNSSTVFNQSKKSFNVGTFQKLKASSQKNVEQADYDIE